MALLNIQSYTFLKSSRFLFQFTKLPNVLNIGPNLETQKKQTTLSVAQAEINNSLENLDVSIFMRDVGFVCDSIEFPGQSMSPVAYRIPGTHEIKVPFQRDFQEITATFLYPETLPMYDFFSAWMVSASPRNTTNRFFDDIVAQARIVQFSEGGEIGENEILIDQQVPYLTVNLLNVYPINVAPLAGNWGDDGFHKISVTFFFEDMTTKSHGTKNPNTDWELQLRQNAISDDQLASDLLSDPSLNIRIKF